MKFKYLIYSALIPLLNSSSAQLIEAPFSQNNFLLESDSSNQLYFNYKVNKKQTLYHISKSFQVKLDSIIHFNKELKSVGLRENDLLKIPINKNQIRFDESKQIDSTIGLYYKVRSGENLYQLSKRKFEIDMKKLMQLNKLNNTIVREGTVLFLGFIPLNNLKQTADVSGNQYISAEPEEEPEESKLFTNEVRGVAITEYDELGSGRLFALHNKAAMDSQVEIENPVLHRKVYAKVIGRIPPIYERDVQIIVSAETARLLGAVDKRFFVSIKYR